MWPGAKRQAPGWSCQTFAALPRAGRSPRATSVCVAAGRDVPQPRRRPGSASGSAPVTVERGADRRRAEQRVAARSPRQRVGGGPGRRLAAGRSRSRRRRRPTGSSAVADRRVAAARGQGLRGRAREPDLAASERANCGRGTARSTGALRGQVCSDRGDAGAGARPVALQVAVEPAADGIGQQALAVRRLVRRPLVAEVAEQQRDRQRRVSALGPVDEAQHLVDREEVVGEAAAHEQTAAVRGSGRSRRPSGSGQLVDDRRAPGVVVGLAGVGSRDPGDDVGLGVGARRRQEPHRPARDERLADRLPGPGRELGGGEDRVGERRLEDADRLVPPTGGVTPCRAACGRSARSRRPGRSTGSPARRPRSAAACPSGDAPRHQPAVGSITRSRSAASIERLPAAVGVAGHPDPARPPRRPRPPGARSAPACRGPRSGRRRDGCSPSTHAAALAARASGVPHDPHSPRAV